MQLAFYRAFQKRHKDEKYFNYIKRLWLDWVIAIFSFGKYSHVEIVVNDMWFSVSPRINLASYRFIKPKKNSWDFLELDLSPDEESIVINEMQKYIGMSYDYPGALTSNTPICIQIDSKIFCSEVCTNILNKTPSYSFLLDGCKYSPVALYNAIIRNKRK